MSDVPDYEVHCPGCGEKYHKPLYDWQYIHCFDCGEYFEKHTGKRIEHSGTPQQLPKKYWKTDRETKG